MTTWAEGAEEAIEIMVSGSDNLEVDHLKQLRTLYDGYMTDDIGYKELGLCALEGLYAEGHYSRQFLLEDTQKLLVGKQHDYGNENITRFGHGGIGIRINDKICRLENLTDKEHQVDESIEDTWQDILGYCIIGIMMHNETFSLPLIEVERHRIIPFDWTRPDWPYSDSMYR